MTADDLMPLVNAAREGSDTARGELIERMRPRLVLWVSGRLSEKLRRFAEPEDVAQDILIVVHRDLAALRATDLRGFMGWFFTVARNRIRDLADHTGALKRQLPPPVSFSQTSASVAASRTEQAARVMEAIRKLPELERQVVLLRRIEERPPAEVAKILGKSKGAVAVALCRALARLAEQMEDPERASSSTPGSL